MSGGNDDYWSSNLMPSKLDGVEFFIQDRRIETGRSFARYRFPYRTGQGVEDSGRKIYIFHLTVPLYRDVAEGLYPGTADKLIAILDDEQKKAEVEYQDPEFGPFKVKVDSFVWDTNSTARNGGMLSLVLEEITFDQSITENLSKPQFGARTLASLRAASLDFAMDTLGVSLPDITDSKFPSLTEMWESIQEGLDNAALAADGVAARIDEVTLVSQKILNFSAGDEIERWSITNSVIDFVGAAEDVGNDGDSAPAGEKLQSFILPDDMSMYDIANWLYKDTIRAEEIAFNNPYSNPMNYPRGYPIKAYAS